MLSERSDRGDFEAMAIDIAGSEAVDFVDDHLRRDRAVKLSGLPGFHRESDPQALDPVGQRLHFAFELFPEDVRVRADRFRLIDGGRRSERCVALRDKEVARVSVGNFFDVAGMTQLIDIFQQ